MRMVELGNTGVVVSRLAFGTGTNGWAGQSNQTRLGSGALARLLRLGCELGVTFWDLADEYGSHAQARAALADLPRERVVIATKTTAQIGRAHV